MELRNRFQGMNSASLCSLAGRYDNPLPPRFLALIASLKIPAQLISREKGEGIGVASLGREKEIEEAEREGNSEELKNDHVVFN